MKKKIQKKHADMLTALGAAICLLCAGGVGIYFYQKNAVYTEMLKIKAEMDSWRQQVRGIAQTIAPGATGPDVVTLQRILALDETVYPEKKITGYYGDGTQAAVKRFQKAHTLPQTGIVDTATKNKMNEVAVMRLCPEQVTMYPDFSLRKITEKTQAVPADYIPPMLEELSDTVTTLHKVCLRADVVPHLKRMFQDAEKDGIHLAVTSGYRNYRMQNYMHTYLHKTYGDKAKAVVAAPGKSEHQLGTAVDITDASIEYRAMSKHFAKSAGGIWMKHNAHNYGFITKYPEEETPRGHHYEPWHWRFIGIAAAKTLRGKMTMIDTPPAYIQKKYFSANSSGEGLTLPAGAAMAIGTTAENDAYTIMQKNSAKRIPIASITKLMTALVATELLQPDDPIPIGWDVLVGKGISGKFIAGETLSLEDAIHAILIASNNEVAAAIAKTVGTESFIEKMNDRARALAMHDTHFVNTTGLDPEKESESINYATASDVAKLLQYILSDKKDIFTILKKQEYAVTTGNTKRTVLMQNTNELLSNRETALRVIGGKTGTTPRAKSNLITIAETPSQKGYLITVILNSKNAFIDTQNLLRYLSKEGLVR